MKEMSRTQRAHQRILHQIVGRLVLARQRAGVSARA